MNNNILAIVPARGGSKGIKNKNIIDLCGKPLISYSIDVALKLLKKKCIKKAIVSTDSKKIACISKKIGIEVPFLRPVKISNDDSKSIDLIIHALDFFEKKNLTYESVILLQPTSPLLPEKQIINGIKIFHEKKEESLISCYREAYINDLVMYKKGKDNLLDPCNLNHNKGVRRQEHGELFIRTGNVYITKVSYLRKNKKIISDRPALLEIDKKYSYNIDTYEDIELVRKILCK